MHQLNQCLHKCSRRLSTQLRFMSVDEKLGPKKPIAAYYRFANENRPYLITKHPELKSFEIESMLRKMWQSMEAVDREKFIESYNTDLINYYSKEFLKHKSYLSTDDRKKIKETRREIEKRRSLLAQQKKIRNVGKPKKPLSPFFRFLTVQKDRQSNESYVDYLKRAKSRWHALNETEKEKYKISVEEEATFKKALLQWEQKMAKLKHEAVVDRKSTYGSFSSKK